MESKKLKANELRIGNLVQDSFARIGTVKGIATKITLKMEWSTLTTSYKEVLPLPLSEYWLQRFGFGKSDDHELGNNSHENFGFYYDYHFQKFRLEADDDRNSADVYMDIKYVHELQNLIFALTKTELTTNKATNPL